MTITHEEALEAARKFLSTSMKDRLEIVDFMPDPFYNSTRLHPEKCWIVHVRPEKFMLDGEQNYILVDKETGTMKGVTIP